MGLRDISDAVSSLFVMLNKETFILFRIEFLVVLVTVLFLAVFIMDVFRRHIHNATMKSIFTILDAVSDSIVIYLEWNNVVKLGLVILNLSRGSRFAPALWSLWALQVLRSLYRFCARSLALNSIWHGKSSEVITEYMCTGHDINKWKPQDCNPETMEGYKYLVHGLTMKSIKCKKPQYILYIDAAHGTRSTQRGRHHSAPIQERSSLVTLDKIWGCRRHLLHPDNTQGNDPKDLSLAFALSRLLRCRFEDATLPQDIFRINRKLVKARILEEPDTNRAFRIMEVQLAFVNDYFNTRYPMVFWSGFFSLFSNLLLSSVAFGVVCWLAVDIRKVYKPPKNDRSHFVHGVNVDVIITWVFMSFMMFKEIWEMVSYLVSDWTKLLLVCSYAQQKEDGARRGCMESAISSFLTSKISSKNWHGHIDQYVFLESYDDRPISWNLIHKITTGMVPNKDDGAKLRDAINVPECVKPAILEKLCASLEKLSCLDIGHQPNNHNTSHDEPGVTNGSLLPKVITSLGDAGNDRYGWACFNLPTCSHVILVWHIATSLCEMKLARGHGVDLSKPGFLGSLLSCFTGCFSSKPYLMDVDDKTNEKQKLNDKLPDKLQKMYITANSLSRYCAYLLVSKPELIPDSFHVPEMVLQETVIRARDNILKNCCSLQSRYDKLMKEAEKAIQDADNVKKTEDVVRLGAMLGKKLMDHESEEECWKILSGVWADLLVHIAPSWNAEVHKQYLESGGEFITYIWALLWHCGIEKSKLWPVENVSGKDAPGPHQDSIIQTANVQPAKETWQACAGPKEEKEGAGIWTSEMKQVGERNGWTGMGQIKKKHSAKSSAELGKDIRVARSEHDQGMLTADKVDGNGLGNVVKGMQNLGNRCYFNAVLQCLLASGKLRARMLGTDAPKSYLGQELKKLFMETSDANDAGGMLMTEELFSHMFSRNPDFKPGMMEDSNNMLGSLLDGLNKEEPTIAESLFRGQVGKHVSSKECEHTSVTNENLDLSLAIPSKKPASIEDCLDLFASGVVKNWHCTDCSAAATGNAPFKQKDTGVDNGQPEQTENGTYRKEQCSHPTDQQTRIPTQSSGKLPVLDGNANQMGHNHNKQKEEKKIYRAATVQCHISKVSPLLTIQLKRFNYVDRDRSDKLEEHVSFLETLDMARFMDPSHVENDNYKYCLVAVIVHDGQMLHQGHNFAYVRASRVKGQQRESSDTFSWFRADDGSITEVSLEQVLECQAYILFYERVEQSKEHKSRDTSANQTTDQEEDEQGSR